MTNSSPYATSCLQVELPGLGLVTRHPQEVWQFRGPQWCNGVAIRTGQLYCPSNSGPGNREGGGDTPDPNLGINLRRLVPPRSKPCGARPGRKSLL